MIRMALNDKFDNAKDKATEKGKDHLDENKDKYTEKGKDAAKDKASDAGKNLKDKF